MAQLAHISIKTGSNDSFEKEKVTCPDIGGYVGDKRTQEQTTTATACYTPMRCH